ncbi:UPF0103-domain-containing protein [Gonapodya prolifera JEL478]|uniref:UPF0103-domain-containing protein n=1 Tax=Gonapodya prolifera (strain JEL478) TaxID=1344416 RepID=A0A139ATZ0_GONPJ|nr:UPF0103-domain-containing protein [Gonapodya prolifera JEL478]|eukprot:KXS20178.1 UPF0103-domain-containing protein [Gonapodya prolifera JEL478]
MIRRATHAGSWYSKNRQKLDKELQGWLDDVPRTVPNHVGVEIQLPINTARAIIVPHAGYSYSGPTAAYGFGLVDTSVIKRVFILGPSHHFYLDGCALSQCAEYETPLGNLVIDAEMCRELEATRSFSSMTVSVDEDEHSIEMQLPYIVKIMNRSPTSYTIIPVLVGAISNAKEAHYGEIFSKYLADPTNLFVISSDFCHWGSRFSYTQKHHTSTRDTPIYQSIEALDREGMDLIERLDPAAFATYLKRTRNTICGRHPIAVLLNAVTKAFPALVPKPADGEDSSPTLKFVRYAQSSQVRNERESSVSYASGYLNVPEP